MQFLFKYSWGIFIIVTILNAVIIRVRSKKYVQDKPELAEGYRKCFTNILIYGNIPWVIMGIGSLSSATNNTFEYLDPKTLNPFVLAFHGSIFILWVLSAYWIYLKNGAEFIGTHPGIINKKGIGGSSNVTAREVKMFFPLILAGGF